MTVRFLATNLLIPLTRSGLPSKRELRANFGRLKVELLEHFEYVEKRWGIPPTLDAVVIGHRTYAGRWVRGCHTTAIWGAFNQIKFGFLRVSREGFSAICLRPQH